VDEEDKKLLVRAVELSEENNKMLLSIRRGMRISRVMSLLYWVLIIGSAIGAFYVVQPFLDSLTEAYGGASSTLEQFRSLQE